MRLSLFLFRDAFFLTLLVFKCYDTKQDKGDDEEEYVTAVFRESAGGESA